MPTYKHNDYYGYINQIQEKGISNPSWFWGNTSDASEARQWLYDNGASAIVDDIYKNTPEEIQRTIPTNYLSQDLQKQRYMTDVHNRNEESGKTVAKVAAGVAGAPSLMGAAVAAPIATGVSLIGGTIGGVLGSTIGSAIGDNIYSRDTENDGVGASISTNRNAGAEIGGLIGGLAGGIAWSKPGMFLENETINKYRGRYTPAETFSSAEREAARNEWSGYLDNIQKLKSRWKGAWKRASSEFGTKFEEAPGYSLNGIDPRVRISERVPDILHPNETYNSISSTGRSAIGVNNAVDAADASLKYYDKWGAFQKRDPFIKIDPTKNISDSVHSGNVITIGTNLKPYETYFDNVSKQNYKLRIDETVGHELGHENLRLNTRKPAIVLKNPNITVPQYDSESPWYGNDYSKINSTTKSIMKPKVHVNSHDYELSESFSDAFGLRTSMDVNKIGNGHKYNALDVLRYKYTVPGGRSNRFLLQHPGLKNQVNALNTSVTLKKGGVVKAQNGTITPYYNPNPINEWIRKTVDNVPALRSIQRGIQHYKSSPMHDIASFVIPDDINSAMVPVAGGIKGATNTMFNRTKAGWNSKKYYDQLLSKLEQIPADKMSKPLIKQIKDFYSACKISIAKQNPATSRLYKQWAEEAGQKAVNMADNVLIDINREKELLRIQQQQQRAKNIVPHNAKTQAIIDSDFTPFDEMKTLQQTGSRAKTTMNFRMSDMMWKDGGVIKA